MTLATWIDGARADAMPVPWSGLEQGDGVFETMAVVGGRVRLLERHLARLATGCARLALPLPDHARLRSELATAAAVPGAGVVKLIVARGRPGGAVDGATRLLYAAGPRQRPPAWWSEGVIVHLCALRLAPVPELAGLKHLSRLELRLARAEWTDPSVAEGLLQDVHGAVLCGTMTNVFAVVDSRLVTPDTARGGVAGVMRAALLDAWRAAGRAVQVRELRAAELERAGEIFLTNALVGAWPVRRLGEREFAPGPAVREAQAYVAGWSA
jgi:4-amino-4-deoxychorismate lyase